MRLLLLENQSAFAERLAAALSEDEQVECECASINTYEQRTEQCDDEHFDAIILDLRRDTKNSLRLCGRVVKRTTNVPVIAVTAIDDPDEAVRIIRAGAEEVCLRDEFDADALRDRIRCAIERHRITSLLASEIHQTAPAMCGTADTAFESSLPKGPFECSEQPSEQESLRLACVVAPGLEANAASELAWTESLGIPVDITLVDGTDELVEYIITVSVDAVVMYLHDLDSATLEAIATVRTHRENTVIVLTVPALEADIALQVIRHGADDYVASTNPSHETVARYLRQGLARRQRVDAISNDAEDEKSPSRFQRRKSRHQQRSPRYYVTKSAIAIPIHPNLTPDQSVRAEGFTVDVSESGIGFEIGELSQLPSELLLVGVEGDDGVLYFATVEVRNWSLREGRMHVGAQFVTGARDLLREENLTPMFQPESQDFTPQLPVETLLEWAALGIFRPVLIDRIYACPQCGGMPTFRSGCRSCGSIHVASHQLIHHYDCSYLGRINEFESNGIVICPKCGVEGSIDGNDFERLSGPCHCLECNWSDTATEVVGQCLRCNWHFPLNNASERELIGYHVNRLDYQTLLGI